MQCHHVRTLDKEREWSEALAWVTQIVVVLWLGIGTLGVSLAKALPSQADTTRKVQVQHLGSAPVRVTPGATITAAFRVRNRSDSSRTVRLTADVPSEWSLATSLSSVTLPPQESTMRLIGLSVPPQAPAQSKRFRLRVADTTSPSVTGSARVEVRVRAVRKLRLSLLHAPGKITAGDPYSTAFAVTNAGNVPAQVRLQARSARGFPVQMDTSRVKLPPSKTTQVQATVRTTRGTRAAQDHLTLRASAQPLSTGSSPTLSGEAADSTVTARASVDVIPTSGEDKSPADRYPVSMRVQTLGNTGSQTGQIELQGGSDLAGNHSRRLGFFLRGPGRGQVSRFGRRDVYRATYTTEQWTLRGGDQVYRLTSLAAPGRYGFGGEVRHQTGDWTVGGYAQTNRRYGFGSQFASYATYDPHPRAALTASLLRNEGFYEGTLATIEGQFVPWQNASLTVEPGIGRGREGIGAGLRVELSGEHEWGNYRTRHLYTDTRFPNAQGGERLSSAYARLRLTDGTFVFGNAQYRRRTFTPSAPPLVTRSVRLGGSLRGTLGSNRWSVRVKGIDDRRPFRDRQSMRMRGRVQAGSMGLGTTVEVGQVALGDATFMPFRSYRGRLSLRTSWQTLNGFVEYEKGSAYAGTASESRTSFGVTSRTQIGTRTKLNVEAEWRNVSSETLSVWRFASVDLQHDLSFGHTLTAEARLTDFRRARGRAAPEFKFSYEVPIGLPIGRTEEREMLTGRVVSDRTGGGLSDVLMRLGDTKRFTADDGRFALPIPTEGPAYLRLDPSTVDGDRVPMLDLPMLIEPADAASELIIPLQRSGSLTVQVTEYAYPSLRATIRGQEPKAVGGLSNMVLEATDETGRQRRLTNAQGRATFKRLRPGRWTIRLVNPQLSDGKVLEQDEYEVTLEPADQQKLEIQVLPKQRRLDIRQEESLRLNADSGDATPTSKKDLSGSSRPVSAHPSFFCLEARLEKAEILDDGRFSSCLGAEKPEPRVWSKNAGFGSTQNFLPWRPPKWNSSGELATKGRGGVRSRAPTQPDGYSRLGDPGRMQEQPSA